MISRKPPTSPAASPLCRQGPDVLSMIPWCRSHGRALSRFLSSPTSSPSPSGFANASWLLAPPRRLPHERDHPPPHPLDRLHPRLLRGLGGVVPDLQCFRHRAAAAEAEPDHALAP